MTFKDAKRLLGAEEYQWVMRKVWDAMPPEDKERLNVVLARFTNSPGIRHMTLPDKLDLLAQIGVVLQ